MRVIIIAASDGRQRYRFVSVPLDLGGHEVNVIKTRPIAEYVINITKLVIAAGKPDLVILMGVGLKELVACQIAHTRGALVMARLGGDPIKDWESISRSLFMRRRYLGWLKLKINTGFAKVVLGMIDGMIVVNQALSKSLLVRMNRNIPSYVVPQYCEGETRSRKYLIGSSIELLTVVNLRFSDKARGVIWIIKQLKKMALVLDVQINYRVAGAGEHLRDVEEYLSTTDMPGFLNVYLEGYITELEEWYVRADAFLYHSHHDATPNVFLEAKKYGLPLLANDCEEFQTIIERNVSGLLYAGETDFRAQLREVIENESLREVLGKAAREECQREYSITAVRAKLEKALSDFLGNSRPRDVGVP